MTDDKVVALMRQLGIELDLSHGDPTFYMGLGEVQAFAQLVRNAALEEAAVKCEEIDFSYSACEQFVSGEAAFECGKQIRSMKK